VPLILKRFRQAVLAAACSGAFTSGGAGGDTLPAGWRMACIDDLAAPGGLFDGARDHGSQTAVAQNLRTVDYTTSGVRVVRLENLGHLKFINDKYTFISYEKYEGLKQSTIQPGDILFGSFVEDSVRVCLLPRLETPAISKADCFCIRVRPEAVLRDYLVLQLATRRTHDALVEDVHGATRPRIATKHLRALQVPMCSLEEQTAIVEIVRQHFALADAIEHRVQAATARAGKLPEAILSKAFSGELVPTEAELARAQGRTYETAADGLERVRREAENGRRSTRDR
jgi:type I restriction enzyme S subunit